MRIAIGIVEHGRASDAGETLAERFEVTKLINANGASESRWRGFGANHNELIARCFGADWYVALNPDVEVAPGQIAELVESAEVAQLTIAAPLLGTPWGTGGRPQAEVPSPRVWLREAVGGSSAVASSEPVVESHWVSGACLAMSLRRAPDLRFDESYFMYFEDADLCLRACRAGGRAGVVQAVTVGHPSGWSADDPLVWRRGVEFARSALRFAEAAGFSRSAMRIAGLVRFGSRAAMASSPQAVAGARAMTRGFLLGKRASGLRELADEYNASRRAA